MIYFIVSKQSNGKGLQGNFRLAIQLQSLNPNDPRLVEGINAKVVTAKEHYNIRNGDIVKIVKRLEATDYYELDVGDGSYRQWVTGFELTTVF